VLIQVTGSVFNKAGQAVWNLSGTWDNQFVATSLSKFEGSQQSIINSQQPLWKIKMQP